MSTMHRRSPLLALLLACAGALLLAASAGAATQTKTYRVGPIKVGGYEVKQTDGDFGGVPHPDIDGAITRMEVDVTDKDGTPIPIDRLMLHHIVFSNLGTTLGSRRDGTCGQFTLLDSRTTVPGLAERFYAAGEERAKLRLPQGYGYQIRKGEKWLMTWMVMNHKRTTDQAYIQYKVTTTTDPVIGATPYWLDVEDCKADPVYDVPGGRKPGSTTTKKKVWTVPQSGRIVAGGGHVHGGARDLRLTEPDCGGRVIANSEPAWGTRKHPFYNVKPILHEPGPVEMSGFTSAQGIPVRKGERVVLNSRYDASLPHTRIMGIYVLFLAPDAKVTQPCGALPTDRKISRYKGAHRTVAPKFTVPLTGIDPQTGTAIRIAKPAGTVVRRPGDTTVEVGDQFFDAGPRRTPNLSVPAGSTVTWRFDKGKDLHNVTLASGPRGFSSSHLDNGRTYAKTFKVKGRYRIFCALHPVTMTEVVDVR